MKKAADKVVQVTKQMAASGNADLPPNANPGECYARIFVEPTYVSAQQKVLVDAGTEDTKIIPAQYKTVKERVLVKAASEKLEVIPAQFKKVTERVLTKPASEKLVQVAPAKYATKEEKILVEPAKKVWKKGTGPIQKIDSATGEIVCLVEVPAVYKTVKKRVLVAPPQVRKQVVPAEYKTVDRTVVAVPSTTRKIVIPAEYKTVEKTVLVRPATVQAIKTSPKYETVTTRKLVKDGYLQWRSILCDTNLTTGRIAQIQRALQARGFNPGRLDGVIGSDTMAAVNAFQRANKLPVDRYLNIATVRALGVAPN
jgi:hypothetical protein